MEDLETNDAYDEDNEEVYKQALNSLRAGIVWVHSRDGAILQYPYNPGRNKQDSQYKDLLQHAEAVVKGNRGPEKAGTHRALAGYLRSDIGTLDSKIQRVHKLELKAPHKNDLKDLLLGL